MARTPRVDETVTNETVDPTVSDDVSGAYEIGSRWINTTTQKVFYCVSDALGAAVWKDVSTPGVGSHPVTSSTVDPAITDDSNAGFVVGDHWINMVTNAVFQVSDTLIGAAVWILLSDSRIPCADKVIGTDFTVFSGRVCFVHDIDIVDGVTIDVQDDGELLVQ